MDLFAACGGLSTGLHLAGRQVLFAVERNEAPFPTRNPIISQCNGQAAVISETP
jgi:site-specific DNA-cytosine methylase